MVVVVWGWDPADDVAARGPGSYTQAGKNGASPRGLTTGPRAHACCVRALFFEGYCTVLKWQPPVPPRFIFATPS